MAEIQGKRSVHPAQSRRHAQSRKQTAKGNILRASNRRLRRSRPFIAPGRRVFHYPAAKGKVVDQVQFSTVSGYHNIAIDFDDKTCLNFEIDTGFMLEADYSDWKTGNQKVIRAWRPVHNTQ